jgi:hypothetical protein
MTMPEEKRQRVLRAIQMRRDEDGHGGMSIPVSLSAVGSLDGIGSPSVGSNPPIAEVEAKRTPGSRPKKHRRQGHHHQAVRLVGLLATPRRARFDLRTVVLREDLVGFVKSDPPMRGRKFPKDDEPKRLPANRGPKLLPK